MGRFAGRRFWRGVLHRRVFSLRRGPLRAAILRQFSQTFFRRSGSSGRFLRIFPGGAGPPPLRLHQDAPPAAKMQGLKKGVLPASAFPICNSPGKTAGFFRIARKFCRMFCFILQKRSCKMQCRIAVLHCIFAGGICGFCPILVRCAQNCACIFGVPQYTLNRKNKSAALPPYKLAGCPARKEFTMSVLFAVAAFGVAYLAAMVGMTVRGYRN